MKEITLVVLTCLVGWMIIVITRSYLWQKRLVKRNQKSFDWLKNRQLVKQLSIVFVLFVALWGTNTTSFNEFAYTLDQKAIDTVSRQFGPEVANYDNNKEISALAKNVGSSMTLDQWISISSAIYIAEGQDKQIEHILQSNRLGTSVSQIRISSLAVFTYTSDSGDVSILHLFENLGIYYLQDETVNITYQLQSAE